MGPEHRIERAREPLACCAPPTDFPELNLGPPQGGEVLMGDGVSPGVQILKPSLPGGRARVVGAHLRPEHQPESPEIRPQVAGIRVPRVEFPLEDEARDRSADPGGSAGSPDEKIHALRVQIAAEALELGGQHHQIRLVDLLGRVAPPPAGAADRLMRSLDLIQLRRPLLGPGLEGR